MTNRLLRLLLASFLVASFSAQAFEVSKEEEPEYLQVGYKVDTDNCVIGWVKKSFADGSGFGIKEYSKCSLHISEQPPIREALLEKVIADTNGMKGFRGLSWGKIRRGDATDEYANRFASAVVKLPEWNKKKGKLVGKNAQRYHFLSDVINREQIFLEVVTVFEKHGITLEATDVDMLITKKVDGGFVPDNCTVTFDVKRKSGAVDK